MAFVTGDVVATSGEKAYAAVFRHGETVLASWPVDSSKEGEALILEAIAFIERQAREGGFLKESLKAPRREMPARPNSAGEADRRYRDG